MDLQLEKAILLETLGVPVADVAAFHFNTSPDPALVTELRTKLRDGDLTPRMRANNDALRYFAATDLVPVGMCIGPVSLMTKLISDPITPIYMAGRGETAEEEDEIRLVETCLEFATTVIIESLRHQIAAGARAVFIAEPAANQVFFSPKQLTGDGDIFDRYVMTYNRRTAALLAKHGVDLLFHCCGELTDDMVRRFTSLRPALLSLGGSRDLAHDASLLYGNLPSKHFYSAALITAERVEILGRELRERMDAVCHPFILGTECDTLSVSGAKAEIWRKIDALMACTTTPHDSVSACKPRWINWPQFLASPISCSPTVVAAMVWSACAQASSPSCCRALTIASPSCSAAPIATRQSCAKTQPSISTAPAGYAAIACPFPTAKNTRANSTPLVTPTIPRRLMICSPPTPNYSPAMIASPTSI